MPYDAGNLHAVMAGNGDPYAVLTPLRMRLLRGLHDLPVNTNLASALGLTETMLNQEVAALQAASLVSERHGRLRPNFVIADAVEAARVAAHAREAGDELAAQLALNWAAIDADYRRMAVSAEFALADIAFLLVGDRVLDVGLLDALALDRRLMRSAPLRPAPRTPDARYYFWMIEGDADYVGWYGQRTNKLAWTEWQLITFGRYQSDGMPNTARNAFEAHARAVTDANRTLNPMRLARSLQIAAVTLEDARIWAEAAAHYARRLVEVYLRSVDALRQLYAGLGAHAYAPDGFGEFFCWYDHLAYAFAIERLADNGYLQIPAEQFQAALWYEGTAKGGF